jgi:hypothetical protein
MDVHGTKLAGTLFTIATGGFVKPAGQGIVLDCLYEVREDGVLLGSPQGERDAAGR